MALTTFGELTDSIISWGQRNDLDTLVPDFIALAEHKMYNRQNPLELKQLETTGTGTASTTTKFVTLPTDYASMRDTHLVIVNKTGTIKFRAPSQMKKLPAEITGQPCFFTVIGTQIEFDIQPDEAFTIEFQYYAKEAALTEAAPTNSVLTNHPNIYLYGALEQFFLYSGDDERRAVFEKMFAISIAGANNADKLGRYGPAPVMKVDGSTP